MKKRLYNKILAFVAGFVFLTALILLGLMGFDLLGPSQSLAASCDHYLGLDVIEADGAANFSSVTAGQIVCLEGSRRGGLLLKNFAGTELAPIKFINFGGQVIIDSRLPDGVQIQNSRHVRFAGVGSDHAYGITIIDAVTNGITVDWQSSNVEIDHIEISGVPQIGLLAQLRSDCNVQLDAEGMIDVRQNLIFHHLNIQNVGLEGLKIGQASAQSGNGSGCKTQSAPQILTELHGVRLYENSFRDTGGNGIEVQAATQNCTIHHNATHRTGLNSASEAQSGILNGAGSACHIYNNFVSDSAGHGLFVAGNGGNNIYQNIIVNPGEPEAGSGIVLADTLKNGGVNVFNNTIVSPAEYGIAYRAFSSRNNVITKNLIVRPVQGESYYLRTEQHRGLSASDNFTTMNQAGVGFRDPLEADYSLLETSAAFGYGAN